MRHRLISAARLLSLKSSLSALAIGAVALGMVGGCVDSRFADGTGPSHQPYANDLGNWQAPDAKNFEPTSPSAMPPAVHEIDRSSPLVKIDPPGTSRAWKWIVIHHSATHNGGAAEFDRQHRARGWDELGYHFVIGNGTDTADGLIEVGGRWRSQKHGAHAKTDDNRFNELGIGTCVVGNFEDGRPSPKQVKALTALTASLMAKYNIPASRVIGHRDTKGTACPGQLLYAEMPAIRQAAAQAVAASKSASSTVYAGTN